MHKIWKHEEERESDLENKEDSLFFVQKGNKNEVRYFTNSSTEWQERAERLKINVMQQVKTDEGISDKAKYDPNIAHNLMKIC